MKIALIGTTAYQDKMSGAFRSLYEQGHNPEMPTMDDDKIPTGAGREAVRTQPAPELALMESNRRSIEWADEVHVFWDGRSPGTWGDICMAFALRKRIVIGYLEPMSCRNFLTQYAEGE